MCNSPLLFLFKLYCFHVHFTTVHWTDTFFLVDHFPQHTLFSPRVPIQFITMKRTLQQQQEQQQSSAGNAVTIDDNGERDSVTPSRRSNSKPTTTTTTMLASRGDYSNAPLDDVNVDDVLADGTPQYETLGKLQEGNIEFELAMHTSRQRGEATGESSPLSVELALFVRQLPTARTRCCGAL